MGREPELLRIDRLLADARGARTSAVLLEGGSGVGKSALLRAAVDRADGFTVVAARGVESEAALAHACLLELLSPLRGRIDEVPAGQASALSAALGWSRDGGPGDRFLIGAGTLSLLAAAAGAGPVLVVVDDAQWIDAESRAALLFAVRRMHDDPVAFLLAQRAGIRSLPDDDVVPVADLPLPAAEALLSPRLTGPVVRRLVEQIGGNLLALLEVAARLSPAQRTGSAPLPAPLPMGPRLAEVFEPDLAALSTGAQAALLLLAAAGDGRASHVTAALETLGITTGAGAMDEAQRERLVVRDGDALSFRHPLVRTAVWHRADPARRRAAHRALADTALAGDDVTRLWHRAQAADGRDDDLADALVDVADRARVQRGFAASSAALERAASLTTDATRAAERLAAAVADAAVSGEVERTRSLAARLLRGEAGAAARAQTLHVLGVLEEHAGSVPAAVGLLREAALDAEGAARTWTLTELLLAQHRMGDVPGMRSTADLIAPDLDAPDARRATLAAWVRGSALVQGGEPDLGRSLLQRAVERMDGEPVLREDPRFLVLFILGHAWLGDAHAAAPSIERRIRVARERGALGVLVAALSMTAHGRAEILGDHTGAFADAGEAVELAEHLQYVADAAPATELLAWQYAARGRPDLARTHLDRARTLLDRAGTTEVAAHQALTAAFCALCRGDLAETAGLLEARLAADGGVGALGEPLGVAPLLVEAYTGLGRGAEAGALAARYAEVSRGGPPATAALVARCRALTTPAPGEAEAAFEEALAHHAATPDGFEGPHTRLLYGAWLRRSGRRTDARRQLEAAAVRFAAMDLSYWAQRAEAELRATGLSARPRRPLPVEPLTPQETRIAGLAAQGLSNRDIAAAVFLSPKTVEHHLSRVYRKRGLRSRTQLVREFPAM